MASARAARHESRRISLHAGVVNAIWRISAVFSETSEIVPQIVVNKGARPAGLRDVSAAVPSARTGFDRYVVAFGGAYGPKKLNTKFSGGSNIGGVWTPTPSPIQFKSNDMWLFDMQTISWEQPSRRDAEAPPPCCQASFGGVK